MKKVFAFAFCALMGMSICYAQYTKEKVTVAVGEFTGKNAATMRSAALTAMPTCRVNAVDLNNVDKNKVDYIITGRIADPTTEKKTGTLTGDYWATTVNTSGCARRKRITSATTLVEVGLPRWSFTTLSAGPSWAPSFAIVCTKLGPPDP